MNDGRLLAGILQHDILHQKLQVTDATCTLLEIKLLRAALVEPLAHFCAHRHYVLEQLLAMNPVPQSLRSNPLELARYHGTAGDRPAAQKGLMFPGPRVVFLIPLEALYGADQ